MSDQVAIDEQVRMLVDARRPELERLVDEAIGRELETLVAERIAIRNGHALPPTKEQGEREERAERSARSAREEKTCSGPCGRTLPLSAFETRRNKCRECRRQDLNRARERRRAAEQTADAGEPPRGR